MVKNNKHVGMGNQDDLLY